MEISVDSEILIPPALEQFHVNELNSGQLTPIMICFEYNTNIVPKGFQLILENLDNVEIKSENQKRQALF